MPIVLDKEWGGPFYDQFALECATEEDQASIAKLADAKTQWSREDKRRVVAEGRNTFWAAATEHPLTRDLVPARLKLTKGAALPDYIHASPAGMLVSAAFKSCVEAEESAGAGFQFFETAIFHADGSPYAQPYYHWDVFRRIDAVDPSSAALRTVAGPVDGHHRWTVKSLDAPATPEMLILQAAQIDGLAAWQDIRFGVDRTFLSDALFARLTASKLTGFSAQTTWSAR